MEKELIERMFSVGAHYGYSKSRRHPSVKPLIFGAKNRVEIFDLEKTSQMLREALAFAEKLGSEGKSILFVGGKHEAQKTVREAGEKLSMPFVAGRWIGGTLTNISEIKKRLVRLEKLTSDRDTGELAKKYTKKERVLIDREIAKLEENFRGLMPTKEHVPDAMFIVDTKFEKAALVEAQKKGIPVIGLLNSDCDVSKVTHPIVANDATFDSIAFFVNEIIVAFQKGIKNKVVASETEEKPTPAPKGE